MDKSVSSLTEELVPGFEDTTENGAENSEKIITRRLVAEHHRRKKKPGGFQAMGFSNPIYKGIMKRGYKVPTPIQRKCIPMILDGRDVVAMARTGSGKTACFLLPLLERLQAASSGAGARAIVFAPTRELALQTLRFARELGRFCSLRAAAVLGGDSMDEQFSALHQRPDLVVATPGRFVHVCVEMDLKLDAVEYVVFDEADRLFELGFAEQLREIMARLPEDRQTLLFSATLPSVLVEFARAGLTDPVLIRLDAESQLSSQLRLAHVRCREEERMPLLLHLLEHTLPADQQTLVFVATRHHVEYVRQLLQRAGVACTFLYSDMDPTARRQNAERFQSGQLKVLVVTDLAARGIDIPHLDNVINFNFPATAKLFVHRVGRVARAGRSGTAYSLLSAAELPFLFDLYLFLGGDLKLAPARAAEDDSWHGQLGVAPQQLLETQLERLRQWHTVCPELGAALQSAQNAYKQYLRSRPAASKESVRRVKQNRQLGQLHVHTLLKDNHVGDVEESVSVDNYLSAIRNYKSSRTIFEVGATSLSECAKIMQAKRKRDATVIERASLKQNEQLEGCKQDMVADPLQRTPLVDSSQGDITATFSEVVDSKLRFQPSRQRKKKPRLEECNFRDNENYIPHVSKDHHADAGYAVGGTFDREANSAVLDLTMDDSGQSKRQMNRKHWDPVKKNYVGFSNDGKNKKIKTESGVWIPASFQKSGRYTQWKKRSGVEAHQHTDGADGEGAAPPALGKGMKVMGFRRRESLPVTGAASVGKRPEMRSTDQILRQREQTERRRRRSTVGVGSRGRGGGSRGRGGGSRGRGGGSRGRGGSSRGRGGGSRGRGGGSRGRGGGRRGRREM